MRSFNPQLLGSHLLVAVLTSISLLLLIFLVKETTAYQSQALFREETPTYQAQSPDDRGHLSEADCLRRPIHE
jgi:hypothetical protein